MRDFNAVREQAAGAMSQTQAALFAKIDEMCAAAKAAKSATEACTMPDRAGRPEIQVRQFICPNCGYTLPNRCICKPREIHLLSGAELREYQRDKAVSHQDYSRDAEHIAEIAPKTEAGKVEVMFTKPTLVVREAAANERRRNAAAAKKREAVDIVQRELIGKAKLTPSQLDDKLARYTMKNAKTISVETAPSPASIDNAVRSHMEELMGDLGDLW
jgi:predicted RNA-binding Zn-ribbon protein involved in translation (DUF1610 family)